MADTEYDRDAQVALAAQVWAQGRGTSPSPGVSWPAPSAQLERVGAGESGQVSPSVCSEGTEHSHTVSTLWASAAKRSPHIQNHRMTPQARSCVLPLVSPESGLRPPGSEGTREAPSWHRERAGAAQHLPGQQREGPTLGGVDPG